MSSRKYLFSSRGTTRHLNKENDACFVNKNTDAFRANITTNNSQNFMLRLSETLDDSAEGIFNNGVSSSETMEQRTKETTILISDSSFSSSQDDTDWKHLYTGSSIHGSIGRNIKSRANSDILEISSDSDDDKGVFKKNKITPIQRCNGEFDKLRRINYKSPQQHTVLHACDEDINSVNESNNKNNDGKSSSSSTHISPTPELAGISQGHMVSKTNNKITNITQNVHDCFTNSPRRNTYRNSSLRKKNCNVQFMNDQSSKTPSSMKKLTKKDTYDILKILKSTSYTYCSPKYRRENGTCYRNLENNIRPSVQSKNESCPNEKKIDKQTVAVIIDETKSDFEDDVIEGSQANLLKPCETRISKSLQTPDQDQMYLSLSDQKKYEISRWLLTNACNSESDNSCSNICESNRNSLSSGNSSLERFEMKHETPNNRGKLSKINSTNKVTAAPNSDDKVKSGKAQQTTLGKFLNRVKQNNSRLRRSSKFFTGLNSKNNQHMYNEVLSSKVNVPAKDADLVDCVDILDNLYGNIWRSKADIVLPMSEPQKQNVTRISKGVQTERKVIPKLKSYARKISYSDSDTDEFDAFITDIRQQRSSTRKPQKKNRKARDSFINDESSIENSSESVYYTALTNLKESSTHKSLRTTPMSLTTQRALAICDSETDNGDDKDVRHKNLNKKRLFFTKDESDSSTSEFDPGDTILPKPATKKVTPKTPQRVQKPIANLPVTKPNQGVTVKSFLASLSVLVPMANVHPEAKKYRLNYKKTKEELCKHLYKLYNEKIFDNKLPDDMTIEWNVRMRRSAGFCYNKRCTTGLGNMTRSSRIVLATKILDTPDRLRDTLVHEMCHAAAWLINSVSNGHGYHWKGWASKAIKAFPELPPIKRCHDYMIMTKFTYRCTTCGYSIGRHSKSLNVDEKRCGHCYGKFELLVNRTTRSGKVQQLQTPNCSKELSGFAHFVKENYHSVKSNRRSIKHREVMKILGQQFSAIKITKKHDNVVVESS